MALLNFKNGHTPNVSGPFLVKTKNFLSKKGLDYRVLFWNNKRGKWQISETEKKISVPKVLGWVRIREM